MSPYEDGENNFRIAKAISYDFSSEFHNCTPRLEGTVQGCVIGEPDPVEFKQDETEEEESESQEDVDEE